MQTSTDINTEQIPESWVTVGEGTLTDRHRDDPETTNGVYRRKVERYEAPSRYVTYLHNGWRDDRRTEYGLGYIDGDLHYDNFPQSANSLRRQVEGAITSGVFNYGSERSLSKTIRAAPRRLLADTAHIGAGTAITTVALLSFGFIMSLLPFGSAVTDAACLSGGALVAIGYARYRTPVDGAVSGSSYGGGLATPVLVGVIAGAVVAGDLLSQPNQLLLVTGAATFWAGRVAHRLAFEGERATYVLDQRREFITSKLDGYETELHQHGLLDALPDTNPTPGVGFFSGASSAVFTVGWGLGVFYLCLLVVSNIGDTYLLLDVITFTTALSIPVLLAAILTVPLVLLGWRALTWGPSRDPIQNSKGTQSGLTNFQVELLFIVDELGETNRFRMRQKIEQHRDDDISREKLYSELEALVEDGLIEEDDSGLYALTAAGDEALQAEDDRVEQLLDHHGSTLD